MTTPDDRPLRLLVLGSSSALGVRLPVPAEQAWPVVLQKLLAERYGEVECVRRMFVPDTPTSARFLDEMLERYPADWVVLHTTAVGLTIRTVPYRVANLFGARAGRIAAKFIRDTDRLVTPDGLPTKHANKGFRWVARRVIGVDSRTRYQPLVDGYLHAIGRIARLETATAVMGTGQPHSLVAERNPKCIALLAKFNATMAAAARQRRITWIDHDSLDQTAAERDATFMDYLHKDETWHQAMGARAFAALEPLLVAPTPSGAGNGRRESSRRVISV